MADSLRERRIRRAGKNFEAIVVQAALSGVTVSMTPNKNWAEVCAMLADEESENEERLQVQPIEARFKNRAYLFRESDSQTNV